MTPQGHPARSNPGEIIGPTEAVVLMRRTRASCIKARTHRLSIERPDIYTQPCIVVHCVIPAVAPKAGSIYKFVLEILTTDQPR
jgi:hypothetical protein